MMISRLFCVVLQRVLGLDYNQYLIEQRKGFVSFAVARPAEQRRSLLTLNIDEETANALLVANGIGAPDAFGGYYTSARFERAPVAHDMLYVGERWLRLDTRGKLAIAYHEACHCFRECDSFTDYPEISVAFQQGSVVRRFTQYHHDDAGGHDSQWFALLVGSAKRVQIRYPKLLPTVQDVVQTALTADWYGDPMEGVDWNALDLLE